MKKMKVGLLIGSFGSLLAALVQLWFLIDSFGSLLIVLVLIFLMLCMRMRTFISSQEQEEALAAKVRPNGSEKHPHVYTNDN